MAAAAIVASGTAAAASSDITIAVGARKFIFHGGWGANDYAETVVNFTNTLSGIFTARKSAGYTHNVLATITSRSDIDETAFNNFRNPVNVITRTWVGTITDATADVAADPDMGPDGSSNDTTYYTVDKVHWNAAGHARMETIDAAAVNPL